MPAGTGVPIYSDGNFGRVNVMTCETRIFAGTMLAAAILLAPGAARADCSWSIALLNRELDRIEETLPLARASGQDTALKMSAALASARSTLARARSLDNAGKKGACGIALAGARDAADAARRALAQGRSG